MKVYYIRQKDAKLWVKRHPDDPQKPDLDEFGIPRWTPSRDDALEWTKDGGAESWLTWWYALWTASDEEPPCEIEVDDYEDPARTIGGEDD